MVSPYWTVSGKSLRAIVRRFFDFTVPVSLNSEISIRTTPSSQDFHTATDAESKLRKQVGRSGEHEQVTYFSGEKKSPTNSVQVSGLCVQAETKSLGGGSGGSDWREIKLCGAVK